MNRNHLKAVACVSMLLDHIGSFLFPGVLWLRVAGRLAFPLFAFFVGEGARYTRNRKKYFLQLFILGAVCQTVYIAEDIITGRSLPGISSGCWFLNILLTFSCAVPLCCLLLDARKEKTKKSVLKFIVPFMLVSAGAAALWLLREKTDSALYFDYGFCGVLLPLSVCFFDEKEEKLAVFILAVAFYCAVFSAQMSYAWASLAVIVPLFLYNEKPGSGRFKYGFYVFYPVHLAIIYLLSVIP